MFQYRQVVVRMRQGDSDRDIARAGLMGRNKAARFRVLAAAQGWLAVESQLPEEAVISAAVGRARNVTKPVLWHGGQAQASREASARWRKREREALVKFVGSL